MIQFKRGSTRSWKKQKKSLEAGQPGFDKDKYRLKVGDGKKLWDKLPYIGVSKEEVLSAEAKAKVRLSEDPMSVAISTYGTEWPDEHTVGELYLQYYDIEPEVDYIVSAGVENGWLYQKWKSGIARCSKTFDVTTSVRTAIDGSSLYQNSEEIKNSYPFTFVEKDNIKPNETVSIQSPGGLVWLATKTTNTLSSTAAYNIISVDQQTNSATYKISIKVEGFWRLDIENR